MHIASQVSLWPVVYQNLFPPEAPPQTFIVSCWLCILAVSVYCNSRHIRCFWLKHRGALITRCQHTVEAAVHDVCSSKAMTGSSVSSLLLTLSLLGTTCPANRIRPEQTLV